MGDDPRMRTSNKLEVCALKGRTTLSCMPEASGDAIAREFERYLRRRGHDR